MNVIDVGTKGKQLLVDPIIPESEQMRFRNGCMNFYLKSTKYLLDHLPFNRPVIKYAQYLHPDRRTAHGASNAISNLTVAIGSVMKGCLSSVFKTNAVTLDEICDKVRDQWLLYQYEDIDECWYKISTARHQIIWSSKHLWRCSDKCGILNEDTIDNVKSYQAS